MIRYLPVALGIIMIVGLTIPQIQMTDRLSGTNVTAEQQAELLKNVPMKHGNWHGEDMPIDENVRKTAGAIGAVSRKYRNVRTGDVVDLWLIVGHGGVIARHTPDVCYRSSGFAARSEENSLFTLVYGDQKEAPFLTNTFFKEDVTGRRLIRVFWTWYNPETDQDTTDVEWEAPQNSRRHFGNTRALYKLYFTSEMRDASETAEESTAMRFGREFLPVINQALSQVYGHAPSGPAAASAPAATTPSQPTAATPSASSEAPPSEPAAEPAAPAEESTESAGETIDNLLQPSAEEPATPPPTDPAPPQ